ncbi:MAG: urea ABC transporter permease subunit UrtB [Aquisalimonadaceae bacterium]
MERKRFRHLRLWAPILLLWSLASVLHAQDQQPDGEDADTAMIESAPTDVEPGTLAELLPLLAKSNLRERAQLADAIATAGHPRSAAVLAALLKGQLHSIPDDPPRVVIVSAVGNDPDVVDAATGEPLGRASGVDSKRIPVNNLMRRQLRTLIARASLDVADPAAREAAVRELMGSDIDDDVRRLLMERAAVEDNATVREALVTAVALAKLGNEDPLVRIEAIRNLEGSLLSEARASLARIAANDPDPSVRKVAASALQSVQARVNFYRFLENVFFGLSLGSVLLLAAIGLAITFGVMGVINMAHGELIMLGAYTTWGIQQLLPGYIDISVLIAIPAAFLVAGTVGVAIERGVIRFLYGRPLETLLATFGLSLILQQTVRSLFSPLNRSVSSPSWMSGSLQINPVLSITYNRLYILIFGLMVFAALVTVLKRTDMGLKLRAVSQNRTMSRAVGVRASWVDALTFGLGAGIAGVAGVALSQLTNVGPNLGQAYIIDSFLVVVFGGVGNLWGTLVGAMGLGIVNKFLEPYAGAVLAKIVVLVLVILFIQKRPRGLFPQKGRAAEG